MSAAAVRVGHDLRTDDYRRVFAVLEHCDTARATPDFAQRLLDALASQFGFRHTTFFAGTTYRTVYADADPALRGRAEPLFPEYRACWSTRDPFANGELQRMLRETRVSSLHELARFDGETHRYAYGFLTRNGLSSATALSLRLPGGRHAGVGIFDPDPRAVTDRELTALRLLARQLDVISRGLHATDEVLAKLTERQREVAQLVADGLTNSAIGRRLFLTENTVKKYVSRILAATETRSRTELALRVRTQG